MATQKNSDELLEENLQAIKDLTIEVKSLAGRLTAKEILHKRILRLGLVAVFISAIAILGLIISGYVAYENSQNARINCLNANESRRFNLDLWGYIIDSELNDDENTVRETEMIEKLRPYLEIAWRQRDCDDLSKRYAVPRPPLVVE